MRESESQVPLKLMLPNAEGEPRIFAVLKADRRQISDRRLTSRGGRRTTDAIVAEAAIDPGTLRVNRLERTFLEPVGVGI
jgi:hypothetical protein